MCDERKAVEHSNSLSTISDFPRRTTDRTTLCVFRITFMYALEIDPVSAHREGDLCTGAGRRGRGFWLFGTRTETDTGLTTFRGVLKNDVGGILGSS